MPSSHLLRLTKAGLYCEQGDFYIDPSRRVARAVITHAHGDHARWGMERYLCSKPGLGPLRARLGDMQIDALEYGEAVDRNGVRLSLHPAGHILGAAQVRLEYNGEVAVVSGDYKTEADPTCATFEPIRCHTFVTESTFGLPIYQWAPQAQTAAEINAWWRANQKAGRASVLTGYSLGKAQRLLALLDPSIGPIFQHGTVETMSDVYRAAGVALPETLKVVEQPARYDWSQAMVVATPNVLSTPWMNRFGHYAAAFASGWMACRRWRRSSTLDRGFVLSDHVDWPTLIQAVKDTQAEEVWVTHGYSSVVSRYLRELGLQASPLEGSAGRTEPAETST